MKKHICPECGRSNGNHHQHCPEIPEIQEDADIDGAIDVVEATSQAEDDFDQMQYIPCR